MSDPTLIQRWFRLCRGKYRLSLKTVTEELTEPEYVRRLMMSSKSKSRYQRLLDRISRMAGEESSGNVRFFLVAFLYRGYPLLHFGGGYMKAGSLENRLYHVADRLIAMFDHREYRAPKSARKFTTQLALFVALLKQLQKEDFGDDRIHKEAVEKFYEYYDQIEKIHRRCQEKKDHELASELEMEVKFLQQRGMSIINTLEKVGKLDLFHQHPRTVELKKKGHDETEKSIEKIGEEIIMRQIVTDLESAPPKFDRLLSMVESGLALESPKYRFFWMAVDGIKRTLAKYQPVDEDRTFKTHAQFLTHLDQQIDPELSQQMIVGGAETTALFVLMKTILDLIFLLSSTAQRELITIETTSLIAGLTEELTREQLASRVTHALRLALTSLVEIDRALRAMARDGLYAGFRKLATEHLKKD